MTITEEIKKIQTSKKNKRKVQSNSGRFNELIAKMQAKGLVKKQIYDFPTLDEQDRLLYSTNLR